MHFWISLTVVILFFYYENRNIALVGDILFTYILTKLKKYTYRYIYIFNPEALLLMVTLTL